MAIKDILSIYPIPDQPSVYTGLFAEKWESREWIRTNKHECGVSWSKYGDVIGIIDNNTKKSLFEFFHGSCVHFARYFAEKNPEWQHYTLFRGTEELPYDAIVHSYCTREM